MNLKSHNTATIVEEANQKISNGDLSDEPIRHHQMGRQGNMIIRRMIRPITATRNRRAHRRRYRRALDSVRAPQPKGEAATNIFQTAVSQSVSCSSD